MQTNNTTGVEITRIFETGARVGHQYLVYLSDGSVVGMREEDLDSCPRFQGRVLEVTGVHYRTAWGDDPYDWQMLLGYHLVRADGLLADPNKRPDRHRPGYVPPHIGTPSHKQGCHTNGASDHLAA